jgi:flagellar FliL protein
VAAKEEKKEAPEKQSSGGSKKKWIFIGGGILITLIAVGVALFFFIRNQEDDGEGTEEGGKAHESSEGKKAQPQAVFAMEPLIVNIHDGAELRYLKIKIEFETKGGGEKGEKGEFDPYLPQLKDAILLLLSGKQMSEITTVEGMNKLKAEIMACVDKIVPPGKITKVFFTDFVVQ